ncbi:MAG TPA: hypothetical protein VFD91_03370 [Mariniphaga sp.]|nr:hypothetical protein [Mariniphaga sp.]
MKVKINFYLPTFLVFLLFAGITVQAEVKEKTYKEQWPVNSVQTLQIDNRFGEIRIADKGGSNVTIDVVVTVEASSERRAVELLDLIDVNFGKSGNTITAETIIARSFNSKQRFSIDYEVNVPNDKNLYISNKYGNTFINELTADGDFKIQYGNLTVNKLNTKDDNSVKVNLAYGKSDIQEARDVTVTVQYSTMSFGILGDLQLNSKYTVVNLDDGQDINAESKYDTFNFGTVNSLKANLKYTQVKVDMLKQILSLDSGYGGIRVGRIDKNFESVSVTSSYGQISLELDALDYMLDASCEYCGVSYPQDKFRGDRIKENNRSVVRGKVGEGEGGSVTIKSRYGEIKLN